MNFRIRRGRGTMLIGAGKLSRYRIYIKGTGAESRYKGDRSQKIVKVYWIYIECKGANPGATTNTNVTCASRTRNDDK